MKKEYENIGTCIFCGKSVPEVSFNNKPHILPKSMGGYVIGVDICDDCNYYFGSPDTLISIPPKPAFELCAKEVMNVFRHFFIKQRKERLKSVFFSYYHEQRTLKFRERNWQTFNFQRLYARQFKRGLFEGGF